MRHERLGLGPVSVILKRPTRLLVALVLAFALAGLARAERADRDKPVNIESDRMNADDAQKTAVFEGRVVLTQGTLIIRADRLTVRQDSEGFQSAIALGRPATFRQKRDGLDEYIDGEAERIEYDGRADRVQLFNSARVRRDSGDDVRGSYISYDSKTEYFSVQSAKDAPPQSRDARVRAVIMPKTKDAGTNATVAPAAPLELKPAPAIAVPRQD
jgi:lipopolysaccharide export system protein LptA